MFENIISNVIAGAILNACAWLLSRLWNHIKNVSSTPYTPSKHYPRKTVKRQFYICMVTTPLFYGFALTSPAGYAFPWYAFAFISMFLEWGAFDAAFDFYPPDDSVSIPSGKNAESKPK